MNRGKGSGDSKKPSWRWKDRFHRDFPLFTNRRAAYVSRPTFDLLRSSSDEGKCVYHAIVEFLKYASGNLELPLSGRQWSDEDSKLHSFSFQMGNDKFKALIILLGPFNVENEMDLCKQGFLIHAIPQYDKKSPSENNIDLTSPAPQDMFASDEGSKPYYELDTGSHDPDSDESEGPEELDKLLLKLFEKVIDKEVFDNMTKEAMALSSARLLPTDILLRFATKEKKKGYGIAKTREFLSRQFNEVRLLDDITKANLEQIQAIDLYRYSKSTMANMSGRPGVGKSTILHIDACEALLQKGPIRGERKILYLAATRGLIEEAKNEISGLLEHLYLYEYTNAQQKAEEWLQNIHFAVEEDLFLQAPGTLGPLSDFDIFKEQVGNITKDSRWKYWTHEGEENLRYLQRILQNFVYGVFGSPSDFCRWVPGRDDAEIEARFGSAFNFFYPGRKFTPNDDDDLSSDFFATYFWDPGFGLIDERKAAAKMVRGLAELIEIGGLDEYLVDYSMEKYTGMWDSGSVVHKTAERIFSLSNLKQNEIGKENRFWSQILQRGYDGILVDESQDFSALSISTMLQYFSNRGPNRISNHLPFSFVCAGDEYQTIHGTLFQGAMIHINKIYTDWKMSLHEQSTDDFNLLSDDLPNPIKLILRASYRTSNLQTRILDNVIKMMRAIALAENHRRSVSISTFGIRRNGVIAGLPKSGSEGNSRNLLNWIEVMNQLVNQLNVMGKPVAAPKVGFIFPVTEIKSYNDVAKQLENFKALNPHQDILEKIEEMEAIMKDRFAKIKQVSGKEGFADENFISEMKEVGFYDIRGIKGLTVPVAITLNQPVSTDGKRRWYEKLRDLSLCLVMISRSQFGLFMAASDEDVGKTVGGENWQKMIRDDGMGSSLMHSSLPEGDRFADRLRNSSPSELPPKLLLKFAKKEWYVERGWVRLRDSNLLEKEEEGLIAKLKEIFIGVRANGISVYDKIDDLIDLEESAKEAMNTFGELEYFTEAACNQLRHFLLWQDLCKKVEEDGVRTEKRQRIKQISILLNQIEKNTPNHPSGNLSSQEFIHSLIGTEIAENIENLDHPWNSKSENFNPLVQREDQLFPPRFNTGPWGLTPPPKTPPEEKHMWLQQGVFWTPPPNVLKDVLELQSGKKLSATSSKILGWVIDFMYQDVPSIMGSAIEGVKKKDYSYISWILRSMLSGEDSSSFYIRDKIKKFLIQEIPKKPLLCEGICVWLETMSSAAEMAAGIDFISNLYAGKQKSAQRERQRVLSEHLDGERVFKSWLQKTNAQGRKNVVIQESVLQLIKGRLQDVLTKLKTLNSFHGREGVPSSFLQAAFSIRYDVVKTLEIDYGIEESGLDVLFHRIYQRVLTDINLGTSRRPLGEDRRGEMYSSGLRTNPHFNRRKELGDDDPLWSQPQRKISGKQTKQKCPDGSYIVSYNDEDETFICSSCNKVVAMDAGYLWYKSFFNAGKTQNASLESSFIKKMLVEHLSSSKVLNLEKITRQLRSGVRKYEHIFVSKQALALELAPPMPWRSNGHLFNWAAGERKTKIPEVITQRFDTTDSIMEIGINGKTFEGYTDLYSSLEGGPEFTHGHLDLSRQVTTFVEAGAIVEAKALFLANFPLDRTPGEFLQHFAYSLHIEGLVYKEHVARKRAPKAILPFTGEHKLMNSVEYLFGNLQFLPNSIVEQIGVWTPSIRKLPEGDWMNGGSYEKWIAPYVKKMNSYLAISYSAKEFEKIGISSGAWDSATKEALLLQMKSALTSVQGRFFTKEAFRKGEWMREPSGSKNSGRQSATTLSDKNALGSDSDEIPKELRPNWKKDLNKIINTFDLLFEAYQAAQYALGEDCDKMARETYAQEVFRILGTDGLSNVMEAAAQTWDWYVPEIEGADAVEKAVLSSTDARTLLEHHLREKYGLTDKMITMFLDEVERGKPELNRMLDASNVQIWGAYQALINHSTEEE